MFFFLTEMPVGDRHEGGAKVHHLSVCVSSCDAAAVYWCPHRERCDHWCCRLNVRIWSAHLARRLYLLLPSSSSVSSSSSSFSPFSWCFILNCWIKLRPNLRFLALVLSLSAESEHWCTLIAPFISSSQRGVSAGWVRWWRSVSAALLTLSSDFTRWPTRARMSATSGVQPEQLESMRGGTLAWVLWCSFNDTDARRPAAEHKQMSATSSLVTS